MTVINARINVAADGSISGRAPRDVPPGDHPVAITVPEPVVNERMPDDEAWDESDLPSHDMGPWPEGLSLRREDIYGDDGR